jgi:hypothetical protein
VWGCAKRNKLPTVSKYGTLLDEPGYVGGNAMKPGLKPAMIHIKGRMDGDIRVWMGSKSSK